MKKGIILGLVLFATWAAGRLMAAELVVAGVTHGVELLPAASPYGEAKAITNIAYVTNPSPRQNFDLYLPVSGKKPFPLVVWIHGGAWLMGSKDWNNAQYLVRHGYAIASVDYRMTTEGAFPVQIQDCNEALNFIVAHAREIGVDGKRLVVAGGSAGGHLALLVGLARQQPGFGADPAIKPAAILDFFGPTDFTTGLEQLESMHSKKGMELFKDAVPKLLGAPLSLDLGKAKIASPLNYIGTNSPPVLMVHGSNDELVPVAQSRQLQAALDRAGVQNRYQEVPDTGHDGPRFSKPDIEAVVIGFLDGVFKPQITTGKNRLRKAEN